GSPRALALLTRGERRASQVSGSSLRTRQSQQPRRCTSPSPFHGADAAAFRDNELLGTLGCQHFRGLISPRLTRCLPTHRLRALPPPAQGSASHLLGSALAGRDFHPLDDFSGFHGYRSTTPSRPALSGRFRCSVALQLSGALLKRVVRFS